MRMGGGLGHRQARQRHQQDKQGVTQGFHSFSSSKRSGTSGAVLYVTITLNHRLCGRPANSDRNSRAGGTNSMKAIAYTKYGPPDVLQLQERDKPSPQNNEVLVRVRAASVNALDW